MKNHATRPCGCHGSAPARTGVPARPSAPSQRRTVLVVDAGGQRETMSAELAARLVRNDPGARVQRADGTLGSAAHDVVMLSGLFDVIGSIGKGIGSVATGAFKAGKSVVATVAPVAGAAAGFVIGGPAGAAAGAQVGTVVRSTIRPSDRQRVERRANQIAERFALAGVQITAEQAVAFAQMTDAQVDQALAAARTQQQATAQSQVGRQIYSPGPSAADQQWAAQQQAAALAAQQSRDEQPQTVGGVPLPLLLGGAALAAVVLLKK